MGELVNLGHGLQSLLRLLDYLVVRGECGRLPATIQPWGRRIQVTDWPQIVELHGPDVWRTAYRLLSDRDDASDCYQETFLQALDYARRREVTCWPAILRRMATARAIDMLRRRYRSKERCESLALMADEPAGSGPAPDANEQLRESMDQLRQALAAIPPTQAEVFWLSEVEMLSHADIGGQLGIRSQQVAGLLHRAKRKLRQLLEARGVHHEALK
jgi:RNA polymerase sigma-70 factor, ECF subfamily